MQGPELEQQEHRNLEEKIKRYGFSEATYLRRGASGIAFCVVDEQSGQKALLKMSFNGESGATLAQELDVLAARRREARGLNQITSYPATQIPEGLILEPTMRGVSTIRHSIGKIEVGVNCSLLLQWLEETPLGQPGYHRLDKLISEKYNTWTDLEILEIVAPFAYLLAQAHKQGIIYNDIGADKADHLYYDEVKHQLKVIDWANVVFTTDANYTGARQPFHDTAGLARLIYCMRTNENGFRLERNYNVDNLFDNLMRTGHSILAHVIFSSLTPHGYFSDQEIAAMSEREKPIKNGEELYKTIGRAIIALRRPRFILRRPQQPPRQGP